MPNIVLNYQCQNKCSFCFAKSKDANNNCFDSRSIERILPFLKSFRDKEINLLGGEPTLNDDFIDILSILLSEGFTVRIFTNGKIDNLKLEELCLNFSDKYSFCVNRSDPFLSEQIQNLYRKLGFKVQLSITVHKLRQKLSHIIDEILNYKLGRYFRLGISLPTHNSSTNQYINPTDYFEFSNDIFLFIKQCVDNNIYPMFDCGFPECFFNKEQKLFFRENGISFQSQCGINPDILPGERLIPCFPLSVISCSFNPNSNWQNIKVRLNQEIKKIKQLQRIDMCNNCSLVNMCNIICTTYHFDVSPR